MNIENYSKNGYIILKKAISKELIYTFQNEILKKLYKKNKVKNSYKNFTNFLKKIKNKEFFNILNPINNHLFNNNFITKILLQKKILECHTTLLGRDLAMSAESSLTINLFDNKQNYYFKDWHQEIWSGSSISNVQIWMPIFYKSKLDGQIGFIKNSHKWGHIPHSNRKPLKLPNDFSIIKNNLNIGDVVIFSPTLLHKTIPSKYPRLGLSTSIKNFKYNDYSFSDNINWKIYSYSEITKIQRILGNHYLSPFRVTDDKHKIEIN
jgi:ectoine hydroxylase-related dioxygenase (phytanoyl-CoA dioxygenase family)